MLTIRPWATGAAAGVTYKFLSEPSADRAVFRIRVLMRRSTSAQSVARNWPQATPRPSARRDLRARRSLAAGPVFPLELLPTLVKTFNPDTLPIMGALVRWNRFRIWSSIRRCADLLGARYGADLGGRQLPDGAIVGAVPHAPDPRDVPRAHDSGRLAARRAPGATKVPACRSRVSTKLMAPT